MQSWMVAPSDPESLGKRKTNTPARTGNDPHQNKVRAVVPASVATGSSAQSQQTVSTEAAQQRLLIALGKHVIGQGARTRVHESVLMDTIAVAAEFPEVVAMRCAGAAYADAKCADKQKHWVRRMSKCGQHWSVPCTTTVMQSRN
eukprot:gb/GFBE01024030.1/.p1 GENE.gb/GFBE01024030.1/~~gb/GFBE01024030.1/.p1  ORF type:complete len:145 (+),score=7.96 gb/GFBE01024030.1/:1-435(+)